MIELKVASYNIHGGVGADSRLSLRRIVGVIREINPDIIALQEVGSLDDISRGRSQFQALARLTGLHFVAGPTGPGYYGNAILSRFPVLENGRTVLNYRNREPRGMLHCILKLDPNNQPLPAARAGSHSTNQGHGDTREAHEVPEMVIYATHLGLNQRERWTQILRLIARIRRMGKLQNRPFLLMGDFNIWWPISRQLHYLEKHLKTRWHRDHTFPARWPFLSLDRMAAGGSVEWIECSRDSTALSRQASDHLPLVARIRVDQN